MDIVEDLYLISNNINNGYQLENPIDNQRVIFLSNKWLKNKWKNI